MIIKSAKIKKVAGRSVAQRDSIINHGSCLLKSSCSEMKIGNAAFDKNCKKINLHHLLQETDGLILELTEEEHHSKYDEIHRHTEISEIDRQEFNKWKSSYWKNRYSEICR